MRATEPDPARPLRLSPKQKCDVAAQALAALITTGLMAAPFMVDRTAEVPRVEAVVAIADVTTTLPSVPLPSMAPSVAVPPASRFAPRRQRAAAPKTALTAPERVVVENVPVDSLTAKKDGARKPLGRKLAGFFTGNGAYAVRPFPTIRQ